MGIDIAIGLVLFFAFVSGYRQGFVTTIFYVVSILAGFFVTMHFSFLVSDYLMNNFNVPGRWLPVIAFVLTFSLVVILVRLIGRMVEKGVTKLLPTMFNRLLGSVLWMTVSVALFCTLYHFLLTAGVFKPQLIETSQAVPYIEDINHVIEEKIGDVIPFVKGLYTQVDSYFSELAEKNF